MSQWRDISTAPKDRTVVLLYGIWASEISRPVPKPTTDIGFWNDGASDHPGNDWWELLTGAGYACWMRPSHWMPLPPPPQQEEGQNR